MTANAATRGTILSAIGMALLHPPVREIVWSG